MVNHKAGYDARIFQLFFQNIFLCYGLIFLDWQPNVQHYALSIGSCVLFQWVAEGIRTKRWNIFPLASAWWNWGASITISALSLCLLLKAGHWYTSVLAAALAVASKYIFRWHGTHIFNPSAFGIACTLLISKDAWLSPGQWGSAVVLFFFIVVAGMLVVTRVQKLDVSFTFLITYISLLWWRQIYVLGWPIDYWLHTVLNGALLLFSFFMISDPKTSPHHPVARIVWAMIIAVMAFYLAVFKWQYNTAIFMLVAAAPLVPILNFLFPFKPFSWKAATHGRYTSIIKKAI